MSQSEQEPILVGHHSEKRDRRYRDRIRNTQGKGIAALEKAEYYRRRAEAAEKNTAIFSDDPNAAEKLEDKIDRLERKQDFMRQANKLVRKKDRDGLLDMWFSERVVDKLFTPDLCGRLGFPDYELTNNSANIRRLKVRLAEMKTQVRLSEEWKVDIPEGVCGKWRVERFEIPKNSIEGIRCLMAGRPVKPGTYTRLMRGGTLVMSDTQQEIGDSVYFISQAEGRILIHGLGLGCVVKMLLRKPTVTHIDVVEISPEVIELVGRYYKDPRLAIHQGDALTFKFPKGTKWDFAWHDIWDNICADNLPDMKRLCRRYGKRVRHQECWARDWIMRYA